MRKLYLLAALALAAAFFSPDAKATGDSKYYYGKCTVGVAEDSKGLGTVYILEDEKEVEEVSFKAEDYMGINGGGSYGVEIHNTPADGYVLSHFTDQNGESYRYPEASAGTNPYMISLFATSTDEEDPTVFNLLAHFVKESDLPKEDLVEAEITADSKYATFMAPVETTVPNDMLAYTITRIQEDAVIITQLESYDLPAFTPVLLENISMFNATIKATYSKADLPEELPSMTSGLLVGTMEDMPAPMGAYVLEADGDDSKFVKVTDDETTVFAFTAYLMDETASAESYPLKLDSSVSVSSLLDDLRSGEIYDAEGRKLNHLQKGVNIVNGKKVIVK